MLAVSCRQGQEAGVCGNEAAGRMQGVAGRDVGRGLQAGCKDLHAGYRGLWVGSSGHPAWGCRQVAALGRGLQSWICRQRSAGSGQGADVCRQVAAGMGLWE